MLLIIANKINIKCPIAIHLAQLNRKKIITIVQFRAGYTSSKVAPRVFRSELRILFFSPLNSRLNHILLKCLEIRIERNEFYQEFLKIINHPLNSNFLPYSEKQEISPLLLNSKN